MFDPQLALLLSSILLGLAAAWIVSIIAQVGTATRHDPSERYERERRSQLRAQSDIYRWCEPLVGELQTWFPIQSNDSPLTLALQHTPRWRVWTIAEFQATKLCEGLLVALTILACIALTGFITLAILVAAAVAVGYLWLMNQSLKSNYQRHLRVLRGRLPMVVDQMALMIEAGSSFEESLRTVVLEDPDHPLNKALSQVVREIDAGRSRRAALIDFKQRIPDGDINELVYAITKGEELGTPLSTILSNQAQQMRTKRSQWAEKAAAEAEVQIVFPGMLVMIACLIVVIAPILLPAVFSVFE